MYSILNSIPYGISMQTQLCSSITVHLRYIRFWIYCAPAALSHIISLVDRSDTHIDMTTPTATLREQLLQHSIHRRLFRKLTVIQYCVVLYCFVGLNSILNSNFRPNVWAGHKHLVLRTGYRANCHVGISVVGLGLFNSYLCSRHCFDIGRDNGRT